MSDASVAVTKTPPGFNKKLRDLCKIILGITCALLLSGHIFYAILTSALALLCVKEGTLASTRNLKWMILSFISFLSSLFAMFLLQGSDIVDEEKAYSLKICLWLGGKANQYCWGTILGFFLVSAFISSKQ